jgi:hypothetical protein
LYEDEGKWASAEVGLREQHQKDRSKSFGGGSAALWPVPLSHGLATAEHAEKTTTYNAEQRADRNTASGKALEIEQLSSNPPSLLGTQETSENGHYVTRTR